MSEYSINRVITHSGIFHADEIFAVATIKHFYGESVKVIRTRNFQLISEGWKDPNTVVIDVGELFDQDKLAFDHHQRTFNLTRDDGTPYSSFGLVWNFICPKFMTPDIAEYVDNYLAKQIDARDSGYGQSKSDTLDISNVISMMNPLHTEDSTPKGSNEAFDHAVSLAKTFLIRVIKRAMANNIATTTCNEALSESKLNDPRLVVLGNYVPWQSFICKDSDPIYVVFRDISGSWRVQGVPQGDPGSYKVRKYLPSKWLDSPPDVPDFIFVHKGLFIAGAETKSSAIALANIALES